MSDGYDRFDNEGGGGGSFVMGLLTGTVLGAGLGMLFAPKAGSELRNQLSEQAGNLANTASEGVRRAQESAGEWAEQGRKVYDKARDAVNRGADEASR
jgi:gas vesicle protein